ncbi:cysteine desulfurase family protein [Metasolibacillus meyeri]|uniref:cysteine desulfurase family protein n=1 Tax=Metasolibacillus meyeri TaxID=1071052 RepID=UPI000D327FFD|nr:cysteine desulfurase family protein [Metasolibacillus meyeri]
MTTIYLDHAATTPMLKEALAEMNAAMETVYGNASSIHAAGREARKALDGARAILAKQLNTSANEVVLTSGGTEADNMAIFGVAYARQHEGKHIITTQIEHHAVLHACEKLERQGFKITYLPVDDKGRVAVGDVANALTDDTILVTIMYGNNEVGTLQPIEEIGKLLKEHPATFHTDAVQAFGLENIDVEKLQVDLLSASSHKIGGPKGIGLLYMRAGTKIDSLLYGGSQEKKRRAGTENIPAAVGFAKAAQQVMEIQQQTRQVYARYKAILMEEFTQAHIDFTVNGDEEHMLPHIFNVTLPGTDVESFLVNLDMAGVFVSSGSACTAGSIDPSHVLVAMYGKDSKVLRSSIRFSFGHSLNEELVREAGKRTINIVQRLVK